MPEEIMLQSTFGLNRNEIEILLRLVAWGSLAREQVCAIATCGHRSVSINSVNAIIRELRRKLSTHGIEVSTLHGFGFELRQKDREKIVALISPRQGLGVNTEARDEKFRQRG
jgi:DNA-binding response OmpR family regulator